MKNDQTKFLKNCLNCRYCRYYLISGGDYAKIQCGHDCHNRWLSQSRGYDCEDWDFDISLFTVNCESKSPMNDKTPAKTPSEKSVATRKKIKKERIDSTYRAYVSTEEAAIMLGRSPQTLRTWGCKKNGPIRPKRLRPKSPLLWSVAEIRDLLNEPF